MTPVVNGLEGQYADRVAFRYLDAKDGAEGQAAFERYALRGHPTILLVTPDGGVIWTARGVVAQDDVRRALDDLLAGGG
ncbi:MAG: hypothetical protein Kow00124_30840 [Anaerolineae bacterium]